MDDDWIINEYQLQYQEQLGSGVDGEVYRVLLKTKDGRTVEAAAKRFRENKKEKELECQKKELDILRQLIHPNIVQFFYAVLTPLTIIVTEYAAKGSLYEYLKRRTRLPKGQVLEWARHVSCAVQYLQEENVVHRDLKSSNILITADDTLKLCDFGIAKRQCNTEKTNHERGTISWMPPEAFVEKLSSKASDIYSLGIVIWELLTCKVPYQGRESLSILYAVKVHKLRPEIPAHCPPALKNLLEKCWKENRKRRPRIEEVLKTINGLIAKEQHDITQVDFPDGGRKKDIYNMYQKHLAMENKQNAMAEVNIPIENGIETKSMDLDFQEVDINGNDTSFITSVSKTYGRCLRFTMVFVMISLAVIGASVFVWHLLGNTKKSECSLPDIPHAQSFDCEVKPWTCMVSCEDGYEWTGGNIAIACDGRKWNITSKCLKMNMHYQEADEDITAPTEVKFPGFNSGGSSITDDVAGKTTSTDTQNDGNKGDAMIPVSPMSEAGSGPTSHSGEGVNLKQNGGQAGTNQRSSTKLPSAQKLPTTNQPMITISEPPATGDIDGSKEMPYLSIQTNGTVYRLDLGSKAQDGTINATILRDTDDTSTHGVVEICLAQNCTRVHFKPGSSKVVIRFALSNEPTTSMESNQLPDQDDPLSAKLEDVEGLLPEQSDAHWVFSVLTNGNTYEDI